MAYQGSVESANSFGSSMLFGQFAQTFREIDNVPPSITTDQTYIPDDSLEQFPVEDDFSAKTSEEQPTKRRKGTQHSRVKTFCINLLKLLFSKFPLPGGYTLHASPDYNMSDTSCSSNLKTFLGTSRIDLVIELKCLKVVVPQGLKQDQKVPIVFGEVISNGKNLKENIDQLFFYQFCKQRPYTISPMSSKLLGFLVAQDGSRAYLHERQVNDWLSLKLFHSSTIEYRARPSQTTRDFLYDFFYQLISNLTDGLKQMNSENLILSLFQTPSPTFHFPMNLKHQPFENCVEKSANILRCSFSEFQNYVKFQGSALRASPSGEQSFSSSASAGDYSGQQQIASSLEKLFKPEEEIVVKASGYGFSGGECSEHLFYLLIASKNDSSRLCSLFHSKLCLYVFEHGTSITFSISKFISNIQFEQMKEVWTNSKPNDTRDGLSPMAQHFVDEVSSIIFDALFNYSYFHWDIRWPNILCDGRHFYVIDWESGRNVNFDKADIKELIVRRILKRNNATLYNQYANALISLLQKSILLASAAYLCEKLLNECLDKLASFSGGKVSDLEQLVKDLQSSANPSAARVVCETFINRSVKAVDSLLQSQGSATRIKPSAGHSLCSTGASPVGVSRGGFSAGDS